MAQRLQLVFEDANENLCSISVQDPKDGVTRAEAEALANFLSANSIVSGKKGALGHFDKAYLISVTQTQL